MKMECLHLIPENAGVVVATFEKSGYGSEKINVSITAQPGEKKFFDLIIENKFKLLLILILLLYLLIIRKRKRKK